MGDKKKLILCLALLIGICNFIYLAYFFSINNYLPAPFVVEKYDTFMDFFNTLYWSQNDGIYTVWKSIYPPLNFLILDFLKELFLGDLSGIPLEYRSQSLRSFFWIILIFIISLLVTIRISYKKLFNLNYQLIIFLIFLISPPFLFAVERGNLLILCLPLLSLYINQHSRIIKSVFLSILINMKPYFIILYFINIINIKSNKENKNLILLTPIFSLIIFLFTGLILNQEFYLLPLNLLNFAGSSEVLNPQNILAFPTTISSFIYIKEIIPSFNIVPYLAYPLKAMLFYFIYKLIKLVINIKIDQDYLTVISIVVITNYSITSGGYSLIFYIPIIGILYNRKKYDFIAIIGLMFLGLIDLIPIYRNVYKANEISFMSTKVLEISQNLSLSTVIYPIINFVFIIMLYKYLNSKDYYGKC